MRIRPSGVGKIRGAGRPAPAITPIAAGQPGAGYTKLPDNSYVLQADIEAMKRQWPEGHKILTEQGYAAYSQAVTKAQKQAGVAGDIKAKYSSKLPVIMSMPGLGYPMGKRDPFTFVTKLSPKATDIPKAPGYYQYSTKVKVKGKTLQTSDPTGGTYAPYSHVLIPHKTVSFTKEDTKTTTYTYARLEDGSLVLVNKSTETKAGGGPIWVTNAQTGARLAVSRAVYEKTYAGPFFGATHEQKMGAQKLAPELAAKEGKDYEGLSSKVKQGLYQQALGLVSASGYYDKDAITKATFIMPGTIAGAKVEKHEGFTWVKAEGGGFIVTPPKGEKYWTRESGGAKLKGGDEYWATFSPAVASAVKKLKPFTKPDDTFDWAKLITKGTTQEVIAAVKAFGIEHTALKGVRQSIDAHPELGMALSEGGWEGYDKKAVEIQVEWESELRESSPKLYEIYKKEGYDGLEKVYKTIDKASETLAQAGMVEVEDGKTYYKVTEAGASDNPKVVAAIGILNQYFPSEPTPTVTVPGVIGWENSLTGKKLSEVEGQKIFDDYYVKRDKLIKEGMLFSEEWFALVHPENYLQRTSASAAILAKEIAVIGAEVIVPGVYLARHWNEISPAEKALWIAVDVACIIPFITAPARAAKGVATASKIARLKAAGRAVGAESVAYLRAPVDVVIHPIRTGKAGITQLRTLAENIAHPKKIPEAVITTANKAIKLKVSETTSARQAIEIRDKLVVLAARGDRPVVQVGGLTVELTHSPLMKEARGLVHATPDVEALVRGAKVKAKPGVPKEEQGLFVSHEPAIQFAEQSAFGVSTIPLPKEAAEAVIKVGKYKAADLVKIDASPLRSVSLADARNIPKELAPALEAYIRKSKARVYGSFNEWLKNPKAARPNDIDLAVKNQQKVLNDILGIARSKGFQARRVEHAVEVFHKSQWWKIADVDSLLHHRTMIPSELMQPARPINGIYFETLGEQYLRQSYGAVAKTEKAAERAERLARSAKLVEAKLKAAGAVIMRPGIIIYSPKTAERAISSGKLWAGTAEMERRFRVGQLLPEVRQRLFTRIGSSAQRLEIWLEKPLTAKQIAKLKVLGLVEWIKAPFKPPIIISRGRKVVRGLKPGEVDDLAKLLRQSGNVDQARNLIRAERAVRSVRQSPPVLVRATGRLDPLESRKVPARKSREIATRMERLRLVRLERIKPTLARARVRPVRGEIERLIRPERLTRAERKRLQRDRARLERVNRRIARLERVRRLTRVGRLRLGRLRLERLRLERLRRGDFLRLHLPEAVGEAKHRHYKGAVAWRQGALKRKGVIVPVYKVWRYPYRQEDLDTFFQNELPPGVIVTPGGARSAYKSIQLYKGKVPPVGVRQADIGAVLVTVKAPTALPGRAGAITFKKDVKGIRGTSKEALKKLPLGTTLSQLVEGNYNSRIPRSTVGMMLTGKLGKSSSKEIADVLKNLEAEPSTGETGVLAVGEEAPLTTGYTKEEVLKRLPDSKRREVERLLVETVGYAPTRGYPKFKIAVTSKLRSKKKKTSPSRRETSPIASTGRF